jgi:hypothetical protein
MQKWSVVSFTARRQERQAAGTLMATYKPKRSTIYLYDFVAQGHPLPRLDRLQDQARRRPVRGRSAPSSRSTQRDRKKPLITLDEAAAATRTISAPTASGRDEDYLIANIVEGLGGDRYLSTSPSRTCETISPARGQGVAASVNREIEVARPIWRRHRRTHDIGEMPEWGEMFYAVAEAGSARARPRRGGPAVRGAAPDLQDFARFALLSGWRLKRGPACYAGRTSLAQRQAKVKVKGGDASAAADRGHAGADRQPGEGGPVRVHLRLPEEPQGLRRQQGPLNPARLAGERYSFTQSAGAGRGPRR